MIKIKGNFMKTHILLILFSTFFPLHSMHFFKRTSTKQQTGFRKNILKNKKRMLKTGLLTVTSALITKKMHDMYIQHKIEHYDFPLTEKQKAYIEIIEAPKKEYLKNLKEKNIIYFPNEPDEFDTFGFIKIDWDTFFEHAEYRKKYNRAITLQKNLFLLTEWHTEDAERAIEQIAKELNINPNAIYIHIFPKDSSYLPKIGSNTINKFFHFNVPVIFIEYTQKERFKNQLYRDFYPHMIHFLENHYQFVEDLDKFLKKYDVSIEQRHDIKKRLEEFHEKEAERIGPVLSKDLLEQSLEYVKKETTSKIFPGENICDDPYNQTKKKITLCKKYKDLLLIESSVWKK